MSENTEQGPNYNMDCPVTGQDHMYFLSKTIEVFEPFTGAYSNLPYDPTGVDRSLLSEKLYIKREYGLLGCKCGSTVKKEIERI